MVILTLNCGSSSAKYQVYDWDNKDVLASGVVERVTQDGSVITHNAKGKDEFVREFPCPTHKEAVELIIDTITNKDVGVIPDMSVIGAVGHRVLHGGDKFTKSVIVTPEVIETFRSVQDLGPLHNPANILGIEAAQKVLPDVPHCAVMDTTGPSILWSLRVSPSMTCSMATSTASGCSGLNTSCSSCLCSCSW